MKALTKTDFNFPGQKSVYHGKVRDVYNINGEKLVMVATDRNLQKRCTRNLRREVAGRNARKPEIPGTHRYSDYES